MDAGQKDLEKGRYLRTIFDTIPLPTFVVDEDVRIQNYNTAGGQLLGSEPDLALHRRGGDALHCIHAEAKGCGQSELCKQCAIRNSVNSAFTGKATHRQTHKAEWHTRGNTVQIDLLITTTPLPESESLRALLILEDVSELLTLRSLLPICAQCKKVRDEQQNWHSIDRYLHTHMNMKLSHGLCPTCFTEQIKAIEACSAPSSKA